MAQDNTQPNDEAVVKWERAAIIEPDTQKEFTKVKTYLNSAKNFLEVGKTIVEKLKTVVQILTLIESFAQNFISEFINIITETVDDLIDDAASTGVYFLDLFSYHIKGPPRLFKNIDEDNIHEALLANRVTFQDAMDALNNADEFTQSRKMYNDFKSSISNINQKSLIVGEVDDYIKEGKLKYEHISEVLSTESSMDDNVRGYLEAKADELRPTFNNFITGPFTYKRETYYEFINTISEALLDVNDKPGLSTYKLWSDLIGVSTSEISKLEKEQEELKDDIVKYLLGLRVEFLQDAHKSGLPPSEMLDHVIYKNLSEEDKKNAETEIND